MKRYISLLLILILSLSLFGCKSDAVVEGEFTPLANAVYPTQIKYPTQEDYTDNSGNVDYDAFSKAYSEWFESVREKNNITVDDDGFREYVKNTLSVLAADDGQNLVYSPANIYFALSMLAEVTNGNTQSEILSVLGKNNISDLRDNTNNLWQKMYVDNGVYSSILANSLWLRDGISYNQNTVNILKDSYYASTASGYFTDEKYTQAIKDWINANTNNLLTEQSKTLEFNAETIAVLVSTVYFKAKWNIKFNKDFNETREFFTKDGAVTAEFMNSSHRQEYYYGDGYSATALDFEQNGSMYFILPDENKTVYDIINADGVLDILTGAAAQYDYDGAAQKAYPEVNLTVPKFDVASNIDLKPSLDTLGIKTAFDESRADFTPLTTDIPLFLSKVQHAARVKIDEEGCEAAAYTVMAKDAGSAPPDSVVDMVLDRPFIFAVTGEDGLPRFVGIVNTPV